LSLPKFQTQNKWHNERLHAFIKAFSIVSFSQDFTDVFTAIPCDWLKFVFFASLQMTFQIWVSQYPCYFRVFY